MNEQKRTELGVIDSLSLGFSMVSRHPWLFLLPVLLDLFLLFGPRLSIEPLTKSLASWLRVEPSLPEDMQQMVTFSRQMLEQAGEHWNLLSMLAHGAVRLPSFIADAVSIVPVPTSRPSLTMEVTSFAAALGWMFLLGLAGTFLGGLYLTLIADRLPRPEQEEGDQNDEISTERSLLHRLGFIWLRLIEWALLMLAGMLLILIPVSLLSAVVGLIYPHLAPATVSFLSITGVWITFWAGFLLRFVTTAIVLDGVNTLQAMWRSVNVVWRNLWSTLGLTLLSYVIKAGFGFIWQRVSYTSWGIGVSILGTAYIGAGLSAAGLAFYADRCRHWLEARRPRTASTN